MKKIFLTIILLLFMIGGLKPKAEVFGGKWLSSPTYYISTTNSYYNNITTGVSRWNSALSSISANINIQYASALSALVIVNTSAYGTTGWNAMGSSGPVLTSGIYNYGSIKLNTTYMANYSISKRSAICTHEWGHVLGIAHTMSSNIDSLMYYGGSSIYYDDWGIYSPTQYDVDQLDLIY